ncbi:RING-like domain-containing protein [Colletotrichum tofieldiae]|uniref:RING-like domain-containing protein n=1 Tax=Colletotrichum tofieldiae TaxID=708197 RepID=A0A161WH62_9PEZI|nr:RING-like domain-containing protein [Colletotrichum tofieldiae]GKT59184.1 RING-like domain-containing protein [Colletotrichum tofieldiae]GKT80101.1 RING-like domain-containing protein [Colletotrichum tofieldiae]
MLEYLSYKKFKKYKTEKEAEAKEAAEAEQAPQQQNGSSSAHLKPDSRPSPSRRQTSSHSFSTTASGATEGGPAPLLDRKDEAFFRRILSDPDEVDSDDESVRPALPPRSKTPEYTWDSDESRRTAPLQDQKVHRKAATVAVAEKPEASGPSKIPSKIAFLFNKVKSGDKDKQLEPTKPVKPEEAAREQDDLSRVLDDLNLSARNNKAIPLSAESSELVGKFTLVLKDLVNGVPTAVDDLRNLVEDRDGTLKKSFDKLPNSMKKLVTNLPDKFTASLGPEVLAAAAKSQGINAAEVSAEEGIKGAAKKMFTPTSFADLVSKPGAVVGMLKAIVNALKLRWPAFIGTNVIWSVALFLLLFVLWYCHKRGREERIKRENAPEIIDGSGRIEELPDDPALPAPSRSRTEPIRADRDRPRSQRSERSRRSGRHSSGRTTPQRRASPPPDSPRRRSTRK